MRFCGFGEHMWPIFQSRDLASSDLPDWKARARPPSDMHHIWLPIAPSQLPEHIWYHR